MKETEVLEKICAQLNDHNYVFFIDSGYPSDVTTHLTDSLKNCRLNRTITIERRIPDIIGFTDQREIFAVEVKGEKDIRKGIGQAAHYRQGVHISYLAASSSALSEFSETALSCGLGLYSVEDDGEIDEKAPLTNIGATDIDRTRRSLAVKTSRFQSAQNSFPPITRPENSLLPLITIATEQPKDEQLDGTRSEYILSEEKCKKSIKENDVAFNQPKPAISLALTLRLIKKFRSGSTKMQLELTDVGKSTFYLLAGLVGSQKSNELYNYVSDLKNKRYLYKHAPELSAHLRDRYLAIPDIRLLVYVLASHDGNKAELTEMLAETALASPDAFLNLFCTRGGEEEFRELIEKSSPDPSSVEFRKQIVELTSPNSLYNLIYQIRHIELLTEGTKPVHQSDDIEIGSHHWEWDPNMIGEIGAESF